MNAPIERVITDLVQACVLTHDLEATMKNYVEIAGIGPWAVFDFGPPDVTNVLVRGKPSTLRVKLALSWTADRMWEIIQPVGPSPYQEFLDERGEGLHHVLALTAGSFDETVAHFHKHGCEPLMTFEFRGTQFAYIDAMKPLKTYVEILRRPPGGGPRKRPTSPPAYWYPFEPAPDHKW
ncbi:MAG: VOC family protein [Bradyrhizobiaceae bacterium]|nr:VOC family protein [Bradyrhizobiaceae bacterium]